MNKKTLKLAGAIALGMHDALVELTGIIAGLTFALADNRQIILTGVIAAIAASLSMGASNYLAVKTEGEPKAARTGVYTGLTYVITSTLLILPFMVLRNRFYALALTFTVAAAVIFLFNFCVYRAQGRPFIKHFTEMLGICFIVSVIAFAIGQFAKYCLGV